MLEWIEFHRLQGVDHFILYDDASNDSIRLLPLFYDSIDDKNLVEIFPANFLRGSELSDHEGLQHDFNQRNSLIHCHNRYRHKTEWILNIDVDEFMYSQRHGSIINFLNYYKNSTSAFYAKAVRYGTSGLQANFQVDIIPGALTESISVGYASVNATSGLYPLIIEANPRRAPHPQLDENYQELFNANCGQSNTTVKMCDHNNGKSIFKPEHCDEASVHWCEKFWVTTGRTSESEPLLSELRMDHFAFGSAEKMAQMKSNWQANKVAAYTEMDAKWFSIISDSSNKGYAPEIRNALSRFPNVTLE